MFIINIEIKSRNRISEFFHKLHDQTEDILFSIIQKFPERLIPGFVLFWLERYLNKRINELNQQITRQKWQAASLEKVVTNIRKQ